MTRSKCLFKPRGCFWRRFLFRFVQYCGKVSWTVLVYKHDQSVLRIMWYCSWKSSATASLPSRKVCCKRQMISREYRAEIYPALIRERREMLLRDIIRLGFGISGSLASDSESCPLPQNQAQDKQVRSALPCKSGLLGANLAETMPHREQDIIDNEGGGVNKL